MERYNYTDSSSIAKAIKEQYFRNNMQEHNFESFIYDNNQVILPRSEKQLDLDSAASGDLEGAASGYGHEVYCPEGIPVETALFALLGAAALSFGILFMEITMITGAKRKKREIKRYDDFDNMLDNGYFSGLSDLAWQGMFQWHDYLNECWNEA